MLFSKRARIKREAAFENVVIEPQKRVRASGVVLVPQPSDNPKDPLVNASPKVCLTYQRPDRLPETELVNMEEIQDSSGPLPPCIQLHRERLC